MFGFDGVDSFLSDILFLCCDFAVLAQDLFHLRGLQNDFNDEKLQRIREKSLLSGVSCNL